MGLSAIRHPSNLFERITFTYEESAEFTEIHAFKLISVLISLGRKKKIALLKNYTKQGELAMDIGLYRPELYA